MWKGGVQKKLGFSVRGGMSEIGGVVVVTCYLSFVFMSSGM